MDNSKAIGKSDVVVIALGTLGTLFFISMAFSLMPSTVAIFAGIACYIIAGAVRQIVAGVKDQR
jgi:hypothetical protein